MASFLFRKSFQNFLKIYCGRAIFSKFFPIFSQKWVDILEIFPYNKFRKREDKRKESKMESKFYLRVAQILIKRGEEKEAEWYMMMYKKMREKEKEGK